MTPHMRKTSEKPIHFISVDDFTLDVYDKIFADAQKIKRLWANAREEAFSGCGNSFVSLLFAQPSTRTSSSFDKAAKAIGCRVFELHTGSSSIAKGESYEDTMCMMGLGVQAIATRHAGEEGTLRRIADDIYPMHPELAGVSIINAGEGKGAHPTQALLDMFTIQEHFGRKNVRIGFYGDLKHARTAHSLLKLALRNGAEITCIAGDDGLEMPEKYLDDAESKSGERPVCTKDIRNVIGSLDVLYVVRLQKECLPDELHHIYDKQETPYRVTPELLTHLPAQSIILHPLPRLDEMPPEIDRDPRAHYVTQAFNGIVTRAALLRHCLGAG